MPRRYAPIVDLSLNVAASQSKIARERIDSSAFANQQANIFEDRASRLGVPGCLLLGLSAVPEITAISLMLYSYINSIAIDMNIALASGAFAILGLIPAGFGLFLLNSSRKPGKAQSGYLDIRDLKLNAAEMWKDEADTTMEPWRLDE